jgi:hypothetical protein
MARSGRLRATENPGADSSVSVLCGAISGRGAVGGLPPGRPAASPRRGGVSPPKAAQDARPPSGRKVRMEIPGADSIISISCGAIFGPRAVRQSARGLPGGAASRRPRRAGRAASPEGRRLAAQTRGTRALCPSWKASGPWKSRALIQSYQPLAAPFPGAAPPSTRHGRVSSGRGGVSPPSGTRRPPGGAAPETLHQRRRLRGLPCSLRRPPFCASIQSNYSSERSSSPRRASASLRQP